MQEYIAPLCQRSRASDRDEGAYARLRSIAADFGLRLFRDYQDPESLCRALAVRIESGIPPMSESVTPTYMGMPEEIRAEVMSRLPPAALAALMRGSRGL